MQKRKGRIREFEKIKENIDLEEARDERRTKRDAAKGKREATQDGKVANLGKKTKKHKLNKIKIGIMVIVFLLIAAVGMSIKGMLQLKAEQKNLKEQEEKLIVQKEGLQLDLANINSYSYIEEQARIQLKLIMPGETLYVLPTEKNKTK